MMHGTHIVTLTRCNMMHGTHIVTLTRCNMMHGTHKVTLTHCNMMHGTQRHINTSQYDARYTQRQNKTEVKCLPVQSIWSAVRNRQVITISIRCTLFKMTTYNQFTLHFSTLYLSLTRLWQKDERSLSGKIESLKFSINFPPINLVSLTMPLNSSLSSCLLQTPTYYIRLYVGECQICALVTLFRLPV